jgi:branched-chain amino acid transport system permease protein
VSRRSGRVAALRHGGRRGDGRSWPAWTGAARSVARVPVLATLVVLVVALVFPRFEGGNATVMGLATEALTYGLVTMSLNLLMGYGGQVSVGQAGFLAVGAYTTAIVATHFGGLPFIVVLALAGLVTAAVGLVLGLPAARLRGHYLAVATLGFGLAVPEIALNGGSLTGGYTGLIVPPQQLGSVMLNNPVPVYYLGLAVLVVSAAAIRGVLASPTGRRFMAVRDSQDTAPAMGINTGRTKVILFTLSAFFCGLAGYVFALSNSIVEYSSFDFSLSLFFFAAVIVGGLGSMWGSLIGAALLVVIQQEAVSLGGFSEAILGIAVVIVLLLVPGGLASLARRTRAAIAGPRLPGRPGGPAGTGPGARPGQRSSPAGASREG